MATPFTHFVFVDFENVPVVDLGLVEGKPVHVMLLIGNKQTWLDLPLVRQIHRLAAQVELVEVGASGRNALDLTLACYLGQAVQRTPGADFHIVSKDKDFEAMIGHLQAKGVKVARHDSFAALPFLVPARKSPLSKPPFPAKTEAASKPGTTAKTAVSPIRKKTADNYAKLLEQIRSGKNRPGTRAKLMHHVHTVYGQKSTTEQQAAIVNRLICTGVIAIDDKGKVTYPSQA